MRDSYVGAEADISDLITSGAVVAIHNKVKRDLFLYPRGEPFLCRLSGDVLATPGQFSTATSHDLTVAS